MMGLVEVQDQDSTYFLMTRNNQHMYFSFWGLSSQGLFDAVEKLAQELNPNYLSFTDMYIQFATYRAYVQQVIHYIVCLNQRRLMKCAVMGSLIDFRGSQRLLCDHKSQISQTVKSKFKICPIEQDIQASSKMNSSLKALQLNNLFNFFCVTRFEAKISRRTLWGIHKSLNKLVTAPFLSPLCFRHTVLNRQSFTPVISSRPAKR